VPCGVVSCRRRFYSARKLQRQYRAHLRHRLETAAVRLQCWFRALLGYDLLAILRKERCVRPHNQNHCLY
jgi:hypothetical protein